MLLVRRTRASLRRAEFGFFGVCVYTRVQIRDEAMVMFTKGQVERMHKALLGPRRLLGRSSG